MSDTDEVLTESGKPIPGLTLRSSDLIDLVSLIFGPTHTGKSWIVRHMMSLLNGHIDQIMVVSPTETSNHSYEGYVDSPLIHYHMNMKDEKKSSRNENDSKGTMRFLEALYLRAEMMASIYNRANQIETLAKLFSRLPANIRAEGEKFKNKLNTKRDAVVALLKARMPNTHSDKLKEVNEKFRNMLGRIYKKWIVENYAELSDMALTEEEAYALKFISFNPRILLIFDDCAAELKPLFKKDIFRKIFYQGRHVYITCIICCQDETDVTPNLRKNARLSFFTDPGMAGSYFEKAKLPKQQSAYVKEIIPEVFSKEHRKLVHIREDKTKRHFYHFTAKSFPPFRFGSNALHELCQKVKSEGVTLDKTNPFYDKFML